MLLLADVGEYGLTKTASWSELLAVFDMQHCIEENF